VFFGLPMVAFAAVHLLYADFVTRFAPGWLSRVPGRPIGARVVGAILIAAGLSIVFEKQTRMAVSGIAFLVAASSPVPALERHRENAGPRESASGPIGNLQ